MEYFVFVASCLSLNVLANYAMKELKIGKILENNNDMLNYIPSIKDNDIIFPRGDDIRHFSTIYYTRILSNGEKHDRKWLMYSKDTDQIFCFKRT